MSEAKNGCYKVLDKLNQQDSDTIEIYVKELEEELSRYKLQAIVDRETINSVNDKCKMLELDNTKLIEDITQVGMEVIGLTMEKAELVECLREVRNISTKEGYEEDFRKQFKILQEYEVKE